MGLDAATRDILVELTRIIVTGGEWDSAWVTILKSLFPSQSYTVNPWKRDGGDADLILEVCKITPPWTEPPSSETMHFSFQRLLNLSNH
jgi:hypothetical protein